jgi:hypothetical protein
MHKNGETAMIEKFIALVLPLLAMVVLLATDSDPAKK